MANSANGHTPTQSELAADAAEHFGKSVDQISREDVWLHQQEMERDFRESRSVSELRAERFRHD